ncbi:uncharacterized protein TM35_000152090 [Trypanosoma theileri]|uniref:Uncharacterized protein n=1 Tax=Trypanosoma theileri TaxID=67003 RepID=A0A1X0NW69_9TRYP|nr:uncharacterized protein TM35_000152090 [Trypanosoma theileri]ORC88778.1 hypothetical protein TM35_000152090 [Trypanosoma theileri]
MLTSFSWVPKGGMKPVPIHSTDTVDAVRTKLRRQNPEYIADEEALQNEVEKREGDEISSDDEVSGSGGNNMLFGGGADTILEQVESEDEDEINDTNFKETDLVFVTASADSPQPRLELYVYDEPEDAMYVHHDMEIAAFPLSTAWLTDGTMSLCAVGTMRPFVEVWNLDVIDAVEPACLLGGCVKWEDNYRKSVKSRMLKEDSHKDAVLSVRWNTCAQHILVSGSADCSIKLWDLNNSTCIGTYTEPEKVQSLDWHREEANLLLSGGFDAMMVLRDCRSPNEAALRFPTGAVVEHVEFAPHGGRTLYTSTNNGGFMAFEARMNAQPLWQLNIHEADTTFSASPHVAGLLATGGKDGSITLWDARDLAQPPKQIISRSYNTGAVMSLAFHPNSPHILGACGSKGEPLVYTTTNDLRDTFR